MGEWVQHEFQMMLVVLALQYPSNDWVDLLVLLWLRTAADGRVSLTRLPDDAGDARPAVR